MRLSKIRIAGFKSFVDPVTLDLRSNLVGILGPNGCGKSNTIDAVRWVMGESSARHLRGQSMDDVIFNGSSARKPVGQASVELVFDNAAGQLGGEYAQYAEISVKRLVSRDGTSKYFLNSARCRRRDITDIFLGTGLGPRSYAIIEQGMISRLIEAKPEELRNTLEEAAGISRYKDRRRETENRIRHTRENLERLTDLREELAKQLQKLDRQAQAATKFKALRQTERQLEALLLGLQQQTLSTQSTTLTTQLRDKSAEYQAQLTAVRTQESTIEQLREQYSTANDALNTVQGDFYQAGAEISRIEQTLKHHADTRERQQNSLNQLQSSLQESLQHAGEDREALRNCQAQLAELEPRSTRLRDDLEQAEARFMEAEEQLHSWQEQWQTIQQAIAEPNRQAQVEKTRMAQLEQQIHQQQHRLERLQQEAQSLSTCQLAAEVQSLELQLAQIQEARRQAEDDSTRITTTLEQQQHNLQQQQTELASRRSRQQSVQGRLASLETLQQAGLDKDNKTRQAWLSQQGLAQAPRLAEQLDVEQGWETAVEKVLTGELDAICVHSLEALDWNQNPPIHVGVSVLAENPGEPESSGAANTRDSVAQGKQGITPLIHKVHTPHSVHPRLQGIYCINNLQTALLRRHELAAGTSLITPEGFRVGRNWLHIPDHQEAQDGILQRQKELQQLQQQQEALHTGIETLLADNTALQTQLKSLEEQSREAQQAVNRLHREETETAGQLSSLQQRIEQLSQRQQQLAADQDEVTGEVGRLHEEHAQATEQRNHALTQLEALQADYEQLTRHKEDYQQTLQAARTQVRSCQDEYHELQLKIETLRQQQENSQRQLARADSRIELLEQQRDELLEQIAQQDEPNERLQAELEQTLEQRAEIELQLAAARAQVQTLDHDIRSREGLRVEAERLAEHLRDQQEQLKLDWQSVQVRLQAVDEQLAETEYEQAELQALLEQEAHSQAQLETRLAEVQRSIQRLGAINLAALEEFQEQSERKAWLDQQHEDLVSALETLETAIRKIDRETRSRFKDTFDHVNGRLKAMFPRLFGGGECYLEMTGDDLLTTGIMIMARPPGKRIVNIHLMSGGEKALTAVALVFAIFELNPAPFCMLDEVDAPLDEANVGRFCDLVGDMAERVQFIFITHNKRTMELADNLIGVTMREPGVSRLVAVDMTEAVQMAGA